MSWAGSSQQPEAGGTALRRWHPGSRGKGEKLREPSGQCSPLEARAPAKAGVRVQGALSPEEGAVWTIVLEVEWDSGTRVRAGRSTGTAFCPEAENHAETPDLHFPNIIPSNELKHRFEGTGLEMIRPYKNLLLKTFTQKSLRKEKRSF